MRTLKQMFGAIVVGITVMVMSVSMTWAQDQDPVAEAQGPQPGRDYFSQAPFESVDPLTGNLLLQFIDLVLPGNAGRDLRFIRTYSLKGAQPWSFGLAGMVMFVSDTWPLQYQTFLPTFWGGDGAQHGSILLTQPSSSTDVGAFQWVTTDQFWKYDRAAHRLYLPDGSVHVFDGPCDTDPTPSVRCLSGYQDPYGNQITLSGWGTTTLTVTQWLGNGQQRSVELKNDTTPWTANAPMLPTSITYAGRTWAYQLSSPNNLWVSQVTSPVGTSWHYLMQYGTTWQLTVTTPNGGTTQYTINPSAYIGDDYVCNPNCIPVPLYTSVLTDKTLGGRGLPPGHWHWDYQLEQQSIPEIRGLSHQTVATGPDGTTGFEVSTKTTYVYGCLNGACTDPSFYTPYATNWRAYPGRETLLTRRTVEAPIGTVVEDESRTYQGVTAPGSFYWASGTPGPAAFPELSSQKLVRAFGTGSRLYQTTYTYNIPNRYGDYHHATQIAETGELSRTTTRTYEHHEAPSNYLVGLLTSDAVSVGSETFTKGFSYDPATPTTGFLTSQTVSGIQTTFTVDTCVDNQSGSPRACGNVATATRNGHTTTLSYSWGVASQIQTPEYTISRTVNPDGTLASEMRGGRTTTYAYDGLSRVLTTSPPASNPITTTYDNTGGASVVVSRGQSSTTTTLDGFGRPTLIQNSLQPPVQTRTAYDANGRTIYEGFPFTSNDVGTDLFYDGLGRVTQRRHTGGVSVMYVYGPGTVTITDENGHGTTQTHQAFGNPDETRLAAVTDATGTWNYSYNALGNLTKVVAPDGITRNWQYNANNQLISETQPESGTTTYGPYDAAGNLRHKLDANNSTFDYTYDGNERLYTITATPAGGGARVTQITYEPGLDARRKVTIGTLSSAFGYDGAGRLSARTDVIDGRSYTRLFAYDNNDNLSLLTYASGRRVQYQYDNENRIARVTDLTANLDIANTFQYHPSGAVASFTSGNGIINTTTFDQNRYWVRSITAGPLALSYDTYDNVGNVQVITDSRPGMNQSFGYDPLDRLSTANGPWGSATYGYDVHGNRQGGGAVYDPAKLRLLQTNGRTFGYYNNGNLQSSNSDTFGYSPDNHLETSIVGGATTTYVYDADGWREKMITAGTTSYFLRGANGELLTESRNPGGTPKSTRDYIYAGTRLLSVVTVTGSAP